MCASDILHYSNDFSNLLSNTEMYWILQVLVKSENEMFRYSMATVWEKKKKHLLPEYFQNSFSLAVP